MSGVDGSVMETAVLGRWQRTRSRKFAAAADYNKYIAVAFARLACLVLYNRCQGASQILRSATLSTDFCISLSQNLESQPLAGKRIVITVAHEQTSELSGCLSALGAEVISIPCVEIRPPQSFRPLDKALKKIPAYDWLVLTSVESVKALRRRLEKAEMSPTMLKQLSVAAIGSGTRVEAELIGLKVEVALDEYVEESVAAALEARVGGKRVLLVRAKVDRDPIPKRLRIAGAEVDVVEAYETVVPEKSREKIRSSIMDVDPKPDVITFTDSSGVKNFVALLGKGVSPSQVLQDVFIVSIGKVASATLWEVGLKVDLELGEPTVTEAARALAERLGSLL